MRAFSTEVATLSQNIGYVKKNREQVVIGLVKTGAPAKQALGVYQAALQATNNIERSVPVGETVSIPVVFLQDQRLSDCKQSIASVLPDGFHSQADPDTGDRGYRAFFLFWVDMTLKATFLDFFEIFDCGALERLRRGGKIARAVIDDGDRRAQRSLAPRNGSAIVAKTISSTKAR